MAHNLFVTLLVIVILAAYLQVTMAQDRVPLSLSTTPKTISYTSDRGHAALKSHRMYSLKDFLAQIGVNRTNNNAPHKRHIQYDASPELQIDLSDNKDYADPGCPCRVMNHHAEYELRPLSKSKQQIQRSPNCVRRFLVKQLQETNENINRLLDCLGKHNAVCNCLLPSGINLNLSGEQNICCSDMDCSLYEAGSSSESSNKNKLLYPRSCDNCSYKPNLPRTDTSRKSYIKRMAIMNEPSMYHRTNSASASGKPEVNRFSETDSCEEESDGDRLTTKAPRRRKCRKTSKTGSLSQSKALDSAQKDTEH